MRFGFILVTLFLCFVSCNKDKKTQSLAEGIWRGTFEVMDNKLLPFNFEVRKNETGAYTMQIMNAEEVIKVDEISITGDSIRIQTPVFEGFFTGTYTEKSINGEFVKESLERIVPFKANFGKEERFHIKNSSTEDVSGIWEAYFSPNTEKEYVGKGIFLQEGNKVTGTFRTTTGDYRYLDGVMDADSLKLSAFDGAHVFLFTAKVTDSNMTGTFYSGNHFKEPFTATRNDGFELVSPDSLTFIKEGYDKLAFSFPDVNGNQISLADERFANKAIIVQLMGTWCPNCLDETKFLVDYLNTTKNEDVAVIGLAFESAKTKKKAFEGMERLKERIGVPYPMLLAQYGSYDKAIAQEKIPMLNHILSYPTTIFIDKKGKVRKIHTGFNGPATGEKFITFKRDFHQLVTQLTSEQ